LNKIQLKATFSYVTGEINTKENGKDTTYFNLLRRPKTNATASIGTQVNQTWYLMLQASAVGESKDVYYDASFQRHDLTLDNYMLLNLYSEYSVFRNKLKVFADLRNITNKKYADIYGYNTAGFNVYAGLNFKL
jgi:vitamin B12 transporter